MTLGLKIGHMTKIMWQHSSISKANRIQAFSIYGCGIPGIFNRDFWTSQVDWWKAKTSHVMETVLLTNSIGQNGQISQVSEISSKKILFRK